MPAWSDDSGRVRRARGTFLRALAGPERGGEGCGIAGVHYCEEIDVWGPKRGHTRAMRKTPCGCGVKRKG